MNRLTIAIIGAGPAGGQSGYLLAQEGYDVHLFEKNREELIGRPIQCTGIVSKNFGKLFTEDELQQFTLNRVKGASIYSLNNCLELCTDEIQAHIICRIKFDNFLVRRARMAGTHLHPAHTFQALSRRSDGKYKLTFIHDKKTVTFIADKVVGADGPLSKVAKLAHMFGERHFWYGAQAVVQGKFDPEMVELHLGNAYPGFFAWLVPESPTLARIGVAAEKNQRQLFDKILATKGLSPSAIQEMQGGLIPQFREVETEKDGIYLIGDAAMMTKQTTGGGIVMSLLAAQCLRDHFVTGVSYEKLWKKKFFKDLKMARRIRRFLNRLNDHKYDKLISIMNKPSNKELLAKIGDMDFPTKFALRLLFNDVRIIGVFF